MSPTIDFLARHGLMLLTGVTALLSAGALAVAMQRSPAHRQRLGEIVIATALVWLVLACLPLPRWQRHVAQAPGETATAPTPVVIPADLLTETVERIDLTKQFSIGQSGLVLPPPLRRPLPIPNVIAGMYVAGAGLFGAWLLLGHLLLWRMIAKSGTPEAWLVQLFQATMIESGVRCARLRITSKPTRPFSFGVLCPTVVLDARTADFQNAGRLRQIFRHELAHLKRRDACGNALFNLAMVLLYFHPLYWWLRSRAFLARELVADEQAAAASDRLSYAADLLALANSSRAPRRRAMAAVGMFIFTNNLSRRIAMLTQARPSWQTRCSVRWCLGTLLASTATIAVMSLFLGVGPAQAQNAPEPQQDTKKIDTTAREDAARLDLGKFAADQDQAAANLARRKAELDQAQAQLKATEAQLRVLQKQLADTQGTNASLDKKTENRAGDTYDIRLLENQLRGDQLELESRTLDSRQKEELYKKDAVSNSDFEQARFELEKARLKVQRDEIELERVRAGTQGNEKPVGKSSDALKASLAVSSQLDLVNLAESYANAAGQVRLARARLDAARRSSDPHELALAQAEAENAVRKAELLRHIAEIAAAQANDAAQRAEQMYRSGAVPISELDELRTRAQILGVILQTSTQTTSESGK